MKRILIAFIAIFSLIGCSDYTPEEITEASDGQYVYKDDDIAVSLNLVNNNCTSFTVFADGKVYYQTTERTKPSGKYPTLSYRFSNMTITCAFFIKGFNATTSGKLQTNMPGLTGSIELPDEMKFKLSSTPLDANGDGILD